MTSPQPSRPKRREEVEPYGGHRLQRILGYHPISKLPISALVDHFPGNSLHAAFIDATLSTPVYVSRGTVAIHVLWTATQHPELQAGVDPLDCGDLLVHEIEPGETMLIPQGVPFRIGNGIVAFVVGSAGWDVAIEPQTWNPALPAHHPTHGLQIFDGLNRRTICAAHPDLLLERWKITQPLELDLPRGQARYLVNLVDPVAIAWNGGTDLPGRIESRLLPGDMAHVTIVPDGLGYVLIASTPDLATEAANPLRAAGYDRAAIASLGVPPEYL